MLILFNIKTISLKEIKYMEIMQTLMFCQAKAAIHLRNVLQDEPFHLGQTQKYCAGEFGEWDQKITTFPGQC